MYIYYCTLVTSLFYYKDHAATFLIHYFSLFDYYFTHCFSLLLCTYLSLMVRVESSAMLSLYNTLLFTS